jgi:hypothetical protein
VKQPEGRPAARSNANVNTAIERPVSNSPERGGLRDAEHPYGRPLT